jgi:hypothetical protein
MRRIAIVGARKHPDLSIVRAYVDSLPKDVIVVSGGADGVDLCAARHAAFRGGLLVRDFGPQNPTGEWYDDLRVSGHGTGLVVELSEANQLLYRNTLIAAYCTEMTLFPEGSKGGCWDAARQALRFKRPVEIRHVDGKLYEYTGGMTKKVKGSGNWRQQGLF